MLSSVWCFGTGIVVILFLSVGVSCVSFIRCPCGSSNINYTYIVHKEKSDVYTCERWANCQTCKANKMACETCPVGYFGSKCTEEYKNIYTELGIPDDGIRRNLNVCKDAANQFFSQPFIVYVFTFFVLSLVIFFYNLSLIYS